MSTSCFEEGMPVAVGSPPRRNKSTVLRSGRGRMIDAWKGNGSQGHVGDGKGVTINQLISALRSQPTFNLYYFFDSQGISELNHSEYRDNNRCCLSPARVKVVEPSLLI